VQGFTWDALSNRTTSFADIGNEALAMKTSGIDAVWQARPCAFSIVLIHAKTPILSSLHFCFFVQVSSSVFVPRCSWISSRQMDRLAAEKFQR
jgi:hypothetical protein